MPERITPDPRIDWATATISPHPEWIHLADKPLPPDIVNKAWQAAFNSERDMNSIDLIEVSVGFYRLYVALARHFFSTLDLPKAVEDLSLIENRQDATSEMIWDYITHWGETGAAFLDFLDTDEVRDMTMNKVVATIQEGAFDRG